MHKPEDKENLST